ncbi:AbfB domain-containing protein [Archangium lansingense]|uniref:AbfB domain-containing protein n=1 Tax=Archangium lansingense TaxID=2995310 RepID=A0ABT4AP24_9BACT|nr:AbfB domain-containing protein [Archangium lansinium]MCY1083410.1 AbfB domain-containing protein [Archangium lansinium]
MIRIQSARGVRLLSLVAAVSLTGCVIESGGEEYSRGCPSLEGAGIDGLISLSGQRGYFYSLESYAFPDYYVRHADSRGMISYIDSGRDMDDATFRIVPGLSDSRCISFESRNYPGSYLRHQNSELYLSAWSSGFDFQEDATFCPRPGLADSYELSFESCNYPGMYLSQYDDFLYVDEGAGWEFEEDATFMLVDPWSP